MNLGSKFLSFSVDPISEGIWCPGKYKKSQHVSPLAEMAENLLITGLFIDKISDD